LADRGYDIVGVGASERILGLADKLPGVQVHPVSIDLSREDGVNQLRERVEAIGRPLDIAVLNAGVSLGGSFADTSIEAERAMIALNIISQVELAKRAVAVMTSRRQGRILITSSLSATTPTPYESIYGPTRAFMYSYAQGLHEEMREYGVSVTALLPGATATEFHQRAGMGGTKFGSNDRKNDPEIVARQGLQALFAGKDHVIGGDRKPAGPQSSTSSFPSG
jgi:short-subunit dehydrogenase